ncbi:MAG: hypothetical protein CMN48_07995 [SAR116 cluster bacterium]|nr:hypothetical protein [SAR116 cluster bacterium]
MSHSKFNEKFIEIFIILFLEIINHSLNRQSEQSSVRELKFKPFSFDQQLIIDQNLKSGQLLFLNILANC